jgi:hypothetical protein
LLRSAWIGELVVYKKEREWNVQIE